MMVKVEKCLWFFCDQRILIKLKEKLYRATMRPTILYESECWAVQKQHDHKTT